MIKFEIWIGNYHQGQGSTPPTKPKLIDVVWSIDFKTACMKHELVSKLKRIKEGEIKGDLNNQDYPWWFNHETLHNSWLGAYFETKEKALETFK